MHIDWGDFPRDLTPTIAQRIVICTLMLNWEMKSRHTVIGHVRGEVPDQCSPGPV